MNKISSLKYIAGLAFLVSICVKVNAQDRPKLVIQISNFKTSEGVAVVNLFRELDDIPKKPFMTLKGTIINGRSEIIFEDMAHGSYAAIAYHDENSNRTLDHKLGFPNEPIGFSNNWELGLFTGMPTFKKLKFAHQSQVTTIEIKVD